MEEAPLRNWAINTEGVERQRVVWGSLETGHHYDIKFKYSDWGSGAQVCVCKFDGVNLTEENADNPLVITQGMFDKYVAYDVLTRDPNRFQPYGPGAEGVRAARRAMEGESNSFTLRADNGRAMYSNVFTRKCSERRTFMRGGTALDLYVQPGASFRGHHWRTMLKTMYADKLPAKFDLYHARGKVDMAALVDGNMTINKV